MKEVNKKDTLFIGHPVVLPNLAMYTGARATSLTQNSNFLLSFCPMAFCYSAATSWASTINTWPLRLYKGLLRELKTAWSLEWNLSAKKNTRNNCYSPLYLLTLLLRWVKKKIDFNFRLLSTKIEYWSTWLEVIIVFVRVVRPYVCPQFSKSSKTKQLSSESSDRYCGFGPKGSLLTPVLCYRF